MDRYQTVTVWQAEDFEVEVRFGYFGTVDEAASMARDGITGVFVDGLGMWVDLRDGTRSPVREGGFIVRKLRETAKTEANRRALTIDDFDVLNMTIKDIRNEPAMRSFGSQSYGVIDAKGDAVAIQ